MKQNYQGDILFLSEENLEKNFKRLPKEGFVVAEGEATGHKHTVTEAPESLVEIAQDEKGYYLRIIKGNATVTHEEHDTITLPVGDYSIIRQVEYDEVEELRRVQD